MASSLETILIQDASARVVSVCAAFAWITQTCTPEIMHESYDLLKVMLDRFQAAREEIHQCEASGKPVDTVGFVSIFTQFFKTVYDYSTMPIADRVVNYLYLIKTMDRYHNARGGLSQVFQELRDVSGSAVLCVGPEAYEAARAAYKDQLDAQLTKFIADAAYNLVENKMLLDEADRVLQMAKGSRDTLKWSENVLAQNMEKRVSALAQETSDWAIDGDKPSWFINENEITYESVPFGSDSLGYLHYGTWGGHAVEGGARVVVKRLRDVSDDTRRMFVKEVDLWARLMHPYILRLWGACHTSALPMMVYEWADNGSLTDYLTTTKGKRRVWRLLYEVAVAIAYLHSKRIIHADLNLDNVFVGSDGYARVTGFTLSRLNVSSTVYATASRASADGSAGALRWRAPECVGEKNVAPQMPSDVYSFGMCVYEAFRGCAPYDYLVDVSVAEQIANGRLPERPKDIPDAAWELVRRMASMKPQDRPSIQQVVRELWAFAEEEKRNEEDAKSELKLMCSNCHAESLPTGCPSCGSKQARSW